jgi:acyl-CoA thioesterase FadM
LVRVAVKVTEVPAQIVVAVAEIETVGVTFAFTVIVMPELVAVADVKQLAFEVSTQRIISLLAKVVVV